MSEHVTLTLRSSVDESIEAECIAPDVFGSLSESAIAQLPIWSGRRQASLGDVFDVSGERSTSVRVVGDVRRVHGMGTAMAAGELIIEGSAGSRVGAAMTGGQIDVLGAVADDCGLAMAGGALRIRADAGDRVGANLPGASRGASGGEIIVEGSVGNDAGARMRRGLLFVGGNAGDRSARAIIAGTIVVVGRVGAEPAYASKRGSLVVAGGIDVPVTYRYACDYAPPHVRVALMHLNRRYGLAIDRRLIEGRYRRYCGDAHTVAKGEILEWIRE